MIEIVIVPRVAKISETLSVKRILPFRAHRTVGPFCFLDHMGPHELDPSGKDDVLAHPHIGLSTVTYLFGGALMHRDSLGSVQEIKPGDVNWMTAGHGIVHAERSPSPVSREKYGALHGLQAWVALPKEFEDTEPAFDHYPKSDLPQFESGGVMFSLVAGEAYGHKSPVKTHSKLFYLDCTIPKSKTLEFDPADSESAFYLIEGRISVDGQALKAPTLVVFKRGDRVKIQALEPTHGVLFGGVPLGEPRFMYWNFVATTKERLDAAKRLWKEQGFPKIEGENEFVPLPADSGKS